VDPLADHAAKQGDVGGEHDEPEQERDPHPDAVALAELLEPVLEARDLGHEEVDRGDHDRDEQRCLGEALGVLEETRLGLRPELLLLQLVLIGLALRRRRHAPILTNAAVPAVSHG
jgi:hypothetical protein